MKLYEYQSKLIFSQENIPIPQGKLASTPTDARQIADEIGFPVVLKAQVLSGGRGKAGGILLVRNSENVESEAAKILNMKIKELPVKNILVERAISFRQEIYIGITLDRSIGKPVLIVSSEGGVDIEEVARTSPERIIKSSIDPLIGLFDFVIRHTAVEIDLDRNYWKEFHSIAKNLWRVYYKNDATLAEINPLVISTDGHLVALDGKITIDDNALPRKREFVEMRDLSLESPDDLEARKFNLSFVRLAGNIGCLVNGAGLAMATMDNIKIFGGSPANFLDIGGGANAEKVAAALKIILRDPNIEAILINIFGGITRCDEVSKGIMLAIEGSEVKVPMIVRLIGTNAEEGKAMLLNANQITADSLFDAAKLAVQAASGEIK